MPITVLRYARGMERWRTRWWHLQRPLDDQQQPKCGFVVVGERRTISSYDTNPS